MLRLCYLLIEINQLPVRQLERLDGLEDGVPVTVVDVRREGVLRVHRVQGDRGLLLWQQVMMASGIIRSTGQTWRTARVRERLLSLRYCWISLTTSADSISIDIVNHSRAKALERDRSHICRAVGCHGRPGCNKCLSHTVKSNKICP